MKQNILHILGWGVAIWAYIVICLLLARMEMKRSIYCWWNQEAKPVTTKQAALTALKCLLLGLFYLIGFVWHYGSAVRQMNSGNGPELE